MAATLARNDAHWFAKIQEAWGDDVWEGLQERNREDLRSLSNWSCCLVVRGHTVPSYWVGLVPAYGSQRRIPVRVLHSWPVPVGLAAELLAIFEQGEGGAAGGTAGGAAAGAAGGAAAGGDQGLLDNYFDGPAAVQALDELVQIFDAGGQQPEAIMPDSE